MKAKAEGSTRGSQHDPCVCPPQVWLVCGPEAGPSTLNWFVNLPPPTGERKDSDEHAADEIKVEAVESNGQKTKL
jgi:hypothetical protein